jgi:hypothetical protein
MTDPTPVAGSEPDAERIEASANAATDDRAEASANAAADAITVGSIAALSLIDTAYDAAVSAIAHIDAALEHEEDMAVAADLLERRSVLASMVAMLTAIDAGEPAAWVANAAVNLVVVQSAALAAEHAASAAGVLDLQLDHLAAIARADAPEATGEHA